MIKISTNPAGTVCTEIDGTTGDILTEFITLVHAIKHHMLMGESDASEEDANRLLTDAYFYAMTSDIPSTSIKLKGDNK